MGRARGDPLGESRVELEESTKKERVVGDGGRIVKHERRREGE